MSKRRSTPPASWRAASPWRRRQFAIPSKIPGAISTRGLAGASTSFALPQPRGSMSLIRRGSRRRSTRSQRLMDGERAELMTLPLCALNRSARRWAQYLQAGSLVPMRLCTPTARDHSRAAVRHRALLSSARKATGERRRSSLSHGAAHRRNSVCDIPCVK